MRFRRPLISKEVGECHFEDDETVFGVFGCIGFRPDIILFIYSIDRVG